MKKMLLGMVFAASVVFVPQALKAEVVQGYGDNIPVGMAMRQIVPSGILLSFDAGVDQSSPVNWRGGADWKTVLGNVARSQGLAVSDLGQLIRITRAGAPVQASATLAYAPPPAARGGLVMVPYRAPQPVAPAYEPAPVAAPAVEPAPIPAPPVAEIAPPPPAPEPAKTSVAEAEPAKPESKREKIARERREKMAAREAAKLAQAEPAPPAHDSSSVSVVGTPGVWQIKRGDVLEHVLGDWAEKSGWSVVYNTRYAFDIDAGAEFEGDFVQAASALLKSIRTSPVPVATFYKRNNVLVITTSLDAGN